MKVYNPPAGLPTHVGVGHVGPINGGEGFGIDANVATRIKSGVALKNDRSRRTINPARAILIRP